MKNIIYFTKYTSQGASSRLRSYQYEKYLNARGYNVTYYPLFDNEYLKRIYNKKKIGIGFILYYYLKRFYHLFKVRRSDQVVIEKELFPYLPAWAEITFKRLGIDYIVDYDDAIFHNYDLNDNIFIRLFLSNKIDKVMRFSKCVFAGNSYLAKRSRTSAAKKTILLPTVIDLDKYKQKTYTNKDQFILGWIGSPTTFKYVKKLIPVFLRLHEKYPHFKVNIIGAKTNALQENYINFIPWSKSTETEEIKKFTVGIMPLENTPWELGKCSYKLIQYMGCGIAVLASPVGMNKDVVIEGYNGTFVFEDNWFDAIEQYIIEPAMAKVQGGHGRLLVEKRYKIQCNINMIINELEA